MVTFKLKLINTLSTEILQPSVDHVLALFNPNQSQQLLLLWYHVAEHSIR